MVLHNITLFNALYYFRCEFDRIQSTFINTDDFYIAEALIYLKYLHNVVSKQIYSNVRHDIPLENLVYNKVVKIIRYYIEDHEIDKTIFYRFPPNKLKKIELVSSLITSILYRYLLLITFRHWKK